MQRHAMRGDTMSKFFKWIVEIAIAETWVEDGFDLTDERMHDMLTSAIGYAKSTEIRCRVIKRPSMADVNTVQGSPHNRQRVGWPQPSSPSNARFIVTGIDAARNRTIHGVLLTGDPFVGGSLTLGKEPKDYQIEIGDIVEYRKVGDRTVYCVDFDDLWSKYPQYDTRAKVSLVDEPTTRAELGSSDE